MCVCLRERTDIHIGVVAGNDTDPAYVTASAGKDGTDQLGMLWRINGAAIFSKGEVLILSRSVFAAQHSEQLAHEKVSPIRAT